MLLEILIFGITSLVAYFIYTHKKIQRKFDKNGVKYIPGIPLFGNMLKSTIMKRHILDDIDEVYRAFPDDRYVGLIETTTPVIMIRDPELIKNVTVKDFDHFVDHKQFFPAEVDSLFGGSVFMMTGEKWHDMRTTLSPAFTAAKMKQMMPFMTEISKNIIDYLKGDLSEDLDVGDLMRRYTNDVIASAGFGLQVNSLKDKNNEFYIFGQNMFKFTVFQRLNMTFMALFPEVAKVLKIQLFPKKMTDFFRNIVSSTMEYRKQNNVERPDMIQLLMEASKGTLKADKNETQEKDDIGFATVNEELKPRKETREWKSDELVAQVFLFFVAGFESSATALVMAVHELALNYDVQEKLYQEIKEFQKRRGELAYDNLNELKYLDAVLNETFRKWAAALVLDRMCTKPYELPPPREGGKPYTLNKGDLVYSMVNSIHMDPEHYPEPEKFNPDRFSEENKHNIKPFTFMPFGMGPRNCIGSRFALMELKVLMYHFMLNFKIVKCEKTVDPIVLVPGDFNIKVKGGSFVKLEARN